MFQAKSYVGHKLCWPGDLVINSLWAWAKGLGVSKHHGIVSTAYGVYRPKKQYATFADYFHPLFRSEAYDWEFTVRSKGIWTSRLQLTDTSFFDMPVLLPPAEEAEQIGRFIRAYDRRVNRLIRAKQRLIDLLTEQKQAIIQRAVTRGLDPDVPLKPSGVDWLGDVPAHWEVMQLRHVAQGFNNGTSAYQIAEGETPYAVTRIETISTGQINFDKVGYIKEGDVDRRYILKPGDILLSHINSFERVGNCAIYNGGPTLVHGMNLLRVTPRENIDRDFIMLFLRAPAFKNKIRLICKPAINQVSVTTSGIKAIRIAVPDMDEQQAICREATEEIADVDTLIQTAQSEVDLIREYRTRLIADVVTGKLDVRGVAVPGGEGDGADTNLKAAGDEVLEDGVLASESA